MSNQGRRGRYRRGQRVKRKVAAAVSVEGGVAQAERSEQREGNAGAADEQVLQVASKARGIR